MLLCTFLLETERLQMRRRWLRPLRRFDYAVMTIRMRSHISVEAIQPSLKDTIARDLVTGCMMIVANITAGFLSFTHTQ